MLITKYHLQELGETPKFYIGYIQDIGITTAPKVFWFEGAHFFKLFNSDVDAGVYCYKSGTTDAIIDLYDVAAVA